MHWGFLPDTACILPVEKISRLTISDNRMHKSTFGIDIGHHLVKLIELRYDPTRGHTIAQASCIEVPKDRAPGPQGLIRTLKQVFPKRLRRTAESALGVHGNANIVLKRIDLRGLGKGDISFAASFESEQYLPENGTEYFRGFTSTNPVLNPNGKGSELAFVGIRRSMCEFYDEVMMSSHKNPVAFEAAGLALAATYQRASLRSEDRLLGILDIGEFSTKIILLRAGGFFYYDETDVGCRGVISALQTKLGVSQWPAVTLLSGKEAVGLSPAYAAGYVKAEVENFTERVRDLVWRARLIAQTWYFDRMLVCGGGASIPQIRDALAPLFRYGIAVLDPFRGMFFQIGRVSKHHLQPSTPIFAVAMGLALRARYMKASAKGGSIALPGHKRLLGH